MTDATFKVGTLVTVFAEFSGVVVQGQAKQGWICVCYKKNDGSQVRASVPVESVKERK